MYVLVSELGGAGVCGTVVNSFVFSIVQLTNKIKQRNFATVIQNNDFEHR